MTQNLTGYVPMCGFSPIQVEDALLELLEPVRELCGIKTITGFQGKLDEAGWERLRRGFPAILVQYAGSPEFEIAGRRIEERLLFDVYVMDKNRRTHGSYEPGHPGASALLSAVREAVLGVAPLPELGPCLPVSVHGLSLDGAAVYRLRFRIIQSTTLQ